MHFLRRFCLLATFSIRNTSKVIGQVTVASRGITSLGIYGFRNSGYLSDHSLFHFPFFFSCLFPSYILLSCFSVWRWGKFCNSPCTYRLMENRNPSTYLPCLATRVPGNGVLAVKRNQHTDLTSILGIRVVHVGPIGINHVVNWLVTG